LREGGLVGQRNYVLGGSPDPPIFGEAVDIRSIFDIAVDILKEAKGCVLWLPLV